MEDLSGKQFDEYQIESQIGEWGMATIYKAFQPKFERHVALKVLPKHHAKDSEFVGRFKQEAGRRRFRNQLIVVKCLPSAP